MWKRHHVIFVGFMLAFSLALTGSLRLASAAQSRAGTRSEATNTRARANRPAVTARKADRPGRDAAARATATRPATQPASRPASTRPAEGAGMEVTAYYFHRTLRCPSCLHIEAAAKKVIEERFAGEMDAGLLRWQPVNVQQKGNEHFAADYKLSTSSLVLVKKVGGKQVSWKNCEKVWNLHRDDAAYEKYICGEIRAMLLGGTAPAQPPEP